MPIDAVLDALELELRHRGHGCADLNISDDVVLLQAADVITALRAENDATETACAAACAALVIELDNVRAERDALKLDAERYRHLRRFAWPQIATDSLLTHATLDAALDAAIASKP